MRKANTYLRDILAGILIETDEGYTFSYDLHFLKSSNAEPIIL